MLSNPRLALPQSALTNPAFEPLCGQAKEGQKKEAQLMKNSADAAVRAIITTPVTDVDIEEAKLAIDEAHDANVMQSLIEKAFEHVQTAVQVQLMDPHVKPGAEPTEALL